MFTMYPQSGEVNKKHFDSGKKQCMPLNLALICNIHLHSLQATESSLSNSLSPLILSDFADSLSRSVVLSSRIILKENE